MILYGKEKAGITFSTQNNNYVSDVTFNIFDDPNNPVILTGAVGGEVYYSFNSPGSKLIKGSIEFDDGWGNIYTYETDINVTVSTYDVPVIDFDWNPAYPTVQDIVTFVPSVFDTRNDDNGYYYGKAIDATFEIVGDVKNAIEPTGSISYQFASKYKQAPVRMIVRYDDGFSIQQVDILKNVEMANIPPVASCVFVDNGGKCVPSYTWNSNSYDIDDTNLLYLWELYIIVNGEYTLVSTSTQDNFTWVFQEGGDYKLVLTVNDGDGGQDVFEDTFTVTIDTCSNNEQKFIIEWE